MQEELSDREKQILELLASGYGGHEIAAKMNRSANTIATHISRLKVKMKARSTIQAVVMWATHRTASDIEYASWGRPR